MTLRPEVQWFAEQMEARLVRGDEDRGGSDWGDEWKSESAAWLLERLREELLELTLALGLECQRCGQHVRDPDPSADRDAIVAEAADVANFALFLAWTAGKEGRE